MEIVRFRVENGVLRVLERAYKSAIAALIYSHDIETPFSIDELREGFHYFHLGTPLHLLFKYDISRVEMLELANWINTISARNFLEKGVYLERDTLQAYADYLILCAERDYTPKIEFLTYEEMFTDGTKSGGDGGKAVCSK